MADFCRQCSVELFGEENTPKVYWDIEEDEFMEMLCEGCGRIVRVNYEGYRMECNTCVFGHEGVCEEVAGNNYGQTTEINGEWLCGNYKRKE